MSHTHSFTRPTILAAIELLAGKLTQASFDQMILRVELEREVLQGKDVSVKSKSNRMASLVLQNGFHMVQTVDGQMTMTEAVIREAVKLLPATNETERESFLRGLARDGYVVEELSGLPFLRAALPDEIDLPVADDEVHVLLKHFTFLTSLGHLDQAIDAHARGDWAAANAQMRTFLEGLFDEIARHEFPTEIENRKTSENRRNLLAEKGFLSSARNEMTTDGKSFISGLFKMLHSDGSHPGLSDEDHSTFRLHLVLITARTVLRRLHFKH